jgi:hypothetical protein
MFGAIDLPPHGAYYAKGRFSTDAVMRKRKRALIRPVEPLSSAAPLVFISAPTGARAVPTNLSGMSGRWVANL